MDRTENFLNKMLANRPPKLKALAKKPIIMVTAPDSPPQDVIKSLNINPNDPKLPHAQANENANPITIKLPHVPPSGGSFLIRYARSVLSAIL